MGQYFKKQKPNQTKSKHALVSGRLNVFLCFFFSSNVNSVIDIFPRPNILTIAWLVKKFHIRILKLSF